MDDERFIRQLLDNTRFATHDVGMGNPNGATRDVTWWIDDRRSDLGMTWDDLAREAGVSTETLRLAGERRMRTTSKKKIESALRWKRGSIDAIWAGGEPTPLPNVEDYPPELLDAVERQLWDISELSEQDRWTQIYVWRAKKMRDQSPTGGKDNGPKDATFG